MILRNTPQNDNPPPIEFLYGPLHGTKMRIVGEPAELTFIVHGKRAVYTRVTTLDGTPTYYDRDEWESYDTEPYPEAEGVTA